MKRPVLLLVLMHSIFLLNAQIRLTNFGVNSGTSGGDASYFGAHAGQSATGQKNSFVGSYSGPFSTGISNTGIGYRALFSNTTGGYNTAVGDQAVHLNTTGTQNTGVGWSSLRDNTSGSYNSAFGKGALMLNTTGTWNSAFGHNSGPSLNNLTNTTALGNGATTTASHQVRVGNTQVTSIGGVVNFVAVSDGRFKSDVREDVSGLDFVNALRPVSYTLNRRDLGKFLGTPDSVIQQQQFTNDRQTGFIAQEIEATIKKQGFVFHGVEVPQNGKDLYGIRYAELVVPLVKAVQELTAKLEEQQQKIDMLLALVDKSKLASGETVKYAALFQNNPNPFSSATEIKMELPESARQVNLIVYNLEGKQLKDISVKERGMAKAVITNGELAAGMYLYALIVDGKIVDTKRLVLTK